MRVYEKELNLENNKENSGLLGYFADSVKLQVPSDHIPIRFAVTDTGHSGFRCELGIADYEQSEIAEIPSIFEFQKRKFENAGSFNAAIIVPTGIGSEIGGHAGDSTPVARMLGSSCDKLFLHPNVVNASDINEMPDNSLYVEGSVLTRLLMGTVGVSEVHSNRILAVIEDHPEDELFTNAAINSINAARASHGIQCVDILKLKSELALSSSYTSSGTASGRVENLEKLYDYLISHRDDYDAIAISSIIRVPREFHPKYFQSKGEMVNPWGGAEAIFTHTLSSMLNVPTAHSPMLEDQVVANFDPGIVEPRLAAEAISLAFLQCILKGLRKAPRIITDRASFNHPGVYTASDISCLITPDGALGLPVLAALEQGIKVIAVRENKNLMKNDLSQLPWKSGQFYTVDNYWEAAGVMNAIKAGIDPMSVRRPIKYVNVIGTDEPSKIESESDIVQTRSKQSY